ncbi:MAG: tricorn protease [Fimbriimonadaceae bacterium]|nr:tricorn protease [Fimbriimonadaceae bacterium]
MHAVMIAATFLFVLAAHSNTRVQTGAPPLLMRQPTVNESAIVFSFAGDLWSVPRDGGEAERLTTGAGRKSSPHFSPDGKWIAFTGNYDGNTNVFVMPAEGGVPKRLTYEPDAEGVMGWTNDGKKVVFASSYLSNTDLIRMFTVPVGGGLPTALPFPSGTEVSYSPDGSKIAYVGGFRWQDAWKRYRGGQTTPIWIGDLSDSKTREIPRNNSNESHPMWIGDKIFFLSDRKGPVSLWAYDAKSGDVAEKVPNNGFDFKAADAGAGAIVYEQLGSIHLYDLKSGEEHQVPITIKGDFPEARPAFKNVAPLIFNADISSTGQRAVFEARGEIFSVPGSKGDIRNLTNTPGVADRMPSWSPDGQSVAYLSDAAGEYHLVIEKSNGEGKGRTYKLGDAPAYYYNPLWSPDSKKIVYTDNRHMIWVLDLASGNNTRADTNPYENPAFSIRPAWSPDSKWLAYARELDNHMGAIFLYSLETGKATQLTDGLSYAISPVFDKNGKYLYFVASTTVGPGHAWLDLSSYQALNPVYAGYVCVLRKDLPSPLEPQSDEEKIK